MFPNIEICRSLISVVVADIVLEVETSVMTKWNWYPHEKWCGHWKWNQELNVIVLFPWKVHNAKTADSKGGEYKSRAKTLCANCI